MFIQFLRQQWSGGLGSGELTAVTGPSTNRTTLTATTTSSRKNWPVLGSWETDVMVETPSPSLQSLQAGEENKPTMRVSSMVGNLGEPVA